MRISDATLNRRTIVQRTFAAIALLALAPLPPSSAVETASDEIAARYASEIRPLLETYCYSCHSEDVVEADLDLSAFSTLDEIRAKPRVWMKIREMLETGQMPPQDSDQPTADELSRIRNWVREYLTAEAAAHAGDPGRVVLRRLNNAQYTFTLRDLTGVATLEPAHEFPVDGAAGEGFTNTGNSLVMSPALVTKYLDAAKKVAEHAVLLPDGIRFSPSTSRRDWTEEWLAEIRKFYGRYTDSGGGSAVNLQGIQFETNQGGRLPVTAYLAATLAHREELLAGTITSEAVAEKTGLNAKYLGLLCSALIAPPGESPILAQLQERWKSTAKDGAPAIASEIAAWQAALWKFNSIGHIGRHLGGTIGPASWQEAVSPLVPRQEARIKLTPKPGEKEIVVHLTATNAGDGSEGDFVVWENPRIVSPDRADLPLRDLRSAVTALAARRQLVAESAAECLIAASQNEAPLDPTTIEDLAKSNSLDPSLLRGWMECLGRSAGPVRIESHLTQKSEEMAGYGFVRGWVGADALGILANSSDQHVRIPGNLKPHSIAVHPTPTSRVVVGWRSPITATARVAGAVQHAHPECGNGVLWNLELRRGNTRQSLASGSTAGGTPIPFGPIDGIALHEGDVVSLSISPRDGNHSCDLTAVDLTVTAGEESWDLAREASSNILASNPLPDSTERADVWHFYSEPDAPAAEWAVPADSLLARWQSAEPKDERAQLAEAIEKLLRSEAKEVPADSPDGKLYRQLTSLSSPLLAIHDVAGSVTPASGNDFGLDPGLFGRHPTGAPIDPTSLCVEAPAQIAIRLPIELAEGCEFVASGTLYPSAEGLGSVQLYSGLEPVDPPSLGAGAPIVVQPASEAARRFEASLAAMRDLFPAALCYERIVPVDEVITLALYYREDDQLRRLMLDESAAAELDRLWDELLYVSQEPLQLVSAYEQLVEYATQDRPDKVVEFAPMRGPINDRAAAYRQRVVDAEPLQVESVVELAGRAFRRPLRDDERESLRGFYAQLRRDEIEHDEALRLTLARVFSAPAFLYRIEEPPPGVEQRPVSGVELASRLSYFFWSSMPDAELLRAAQAGELEHPAGLELQRRRMLADPKARRLATEFAAQWLHIYQFDQHNEKSESHFPEFTELRDEMYEESIQCFADLFQHDGSLLSLIDADHTFLNEALARHYGIVGVAGSEWRRVEGVRAQGRGGILTQASILSTQAGASRTSPILRGNWLSEVVLGEKLPRPPKNVPQLAETPPEGLTERQLIEKHSSDAACAKCHRRIDPFGFALENYDAIGRFRETDAAGLKIDSRTALADGTEMDGLEGLRRYLLTTRRDDFVRQFNRKLLGFALGRETQLSDEPLLDEMRSALAANDYRVSAAIRSVVESRQFREIRGRDVAQEEH